MSIRVLLADDHALVREALRCMLERESDIEIAGEAGDGRTAVAMAREKKPDIVVMDVSMPDMNGIEATRQIMAESKRTRVICLSMHGEKRFVEAMLHAGASGYILKNDVSKELIGAVRSVAADGVHLSPAITRDVVKHFVLGRAAATQGAYTDLSDREREVLQLIAEGLSTKEIASKLNVSEKTVAAHREHIMGKLNLHSVVELARYALREGIAHL